jgi:hypothetical protein
MNKKHRRIGSTILECTVALALLAAGSVLVAQVLAVCASHRATSQLTVAAQLEAANLAERVALLPYEKLNDSTLQSWQLSQELLELIPPAKLKVNVVEPSVDALPQRCVAIKIEWPAADETPTGVSLTTWRFPSPKESAP